jgi:aspartate/methionine/tyrosine aminotransferase
MEFTVLPKIPLYKAFSNVGKRINLPDGIFYWSGRAKSEAEYSATLGVAYGYEKDFIPGGSSEWLPCYLNSIHSQFHNYDVNNLVPYAPIPGVANLRSSWKDVIIKKSPLDDPHEIQFLKDYITLPIITSGVTNALFSSLMMFLNPGEPVIIPNKRWGNYDNIIIKLIGGKIKSFQFFQDDKLNLRGFREVLEETAINQRKILLLLNFPNNPTGYVPTHEEKDSMIKILSEIHNKYNLPIIVLVDDAYEPYVFDKNRVKHSIFYELQKLSEDIIPVKLDGVTKELLLYGARIGFISIGLKPKWVESKEDLQILKNEIDNKLSGLIRSTISNSNHFYQAIVQRLLNEQGLDQILLERKRVQDLLQIRYEVMNEQIKSICIPGISIDPNGGGFFIFINIDPEMVKANVLADHLLKKYKVGIIPIEKPEENINVDQIPEFVQRIKSALHDFLPK